MNKVNKAVFDANAQCCDIMNNLIKEETMENINVAELLKDCPKGMELDCYLFDRLEFDRIDTDNENYPIVCRVKTVNGEYNKHTFTKYGWYTAFFDYSKCVIFPKGKTTWEGFVPPCKFKDGDIAVSDRGDIHLLRTKDSSYCAYRERWEGLSKLDKTITTSIKVERLATEEEKAKFFDIIKANGYKWNEETKTLEKLVKPKFKVGDIVRSKNCIDAGNFIIVGVKENSYSINIKNYCIEFKDQDNYELVPNKFDITTLVPFESRVLIRAESGNLWKPAIFGCYVEDKYAPYYVLGGTCWSQCIPYEGNEHLSGKTDDCDEHFKTWK